MVNTSKLRQLRFQRKWYKSGAVPQQKIPQNSRVIGIRVYPKEGVQVISLVRAFPSFSGSLSLDLCGGTFCFVVPIKGREYGFGDLIEKLPGNAIPARLFSGNEFPE